MVSPTLEPTEGNKTIRGFLRNFYDKMFVANGNEFLKS